MTLLLATIVVFASVHALPGDAVTALSGEDADPEAMAEIRAKYGLDQPLPVQYVRWLGQVLQGDLGQSVRTGLEVTPMILDKIPITLELALLGVSVAVLLGIPAGVIAATRRGKPADYVTSAFGLFGLSVPNFWLGLMLILLFAVHWDVLPASGYVPFSTDPVENLRRMILPAVVLGTGLAAVLMRQTRSSMLDTLDADYIRTIRAKGMGEWNVIGVHALRNSLITVVTVVGLQLGALISGAVVTEQIFVIPGFGRLIVDAVYTRDFPVIQGVVLVTATAYVAVNLAVDLLYSVLNPRIRVVQARP